MPGSLFNRLHVPLSHIENKYNFNSDIFLKHPVRTGYSIEVKMALEMIMMVLDSILNPLTTRLFNLYFRLSKPQMTFSNILNRIKNLLLILV